MTEEEGSWLFLNAFVQYIRVQIYFSDMVGWERSREFWSARWYLLLFIIQVSAMVKAMRILPVRLRHVQD
jgi:hypothetical protein